MYIKRKAILQVRNEDEIKELRCWQKEWRRMNEETKKQETSEAEEKEMKAENGEAKLDANSDDSEARLSGVRIISNASIRELCCPSTVSNA